MTDVAYTPFGPAPQPWAKPLKPKKLRRQWDDAMGRLTATERALRDRGDSIDAKVVSIRSRERIAEAGRLRQDAQQALAVLLCTPAPTVLAVGHKLDLWAAYRAVMADGGAAAIACIRADLDRLGVVEHFARRP